MRRSISISNALTVVAVMSLCLASEGGVPKHLPARIERLALRGPEQDRERSGEREAAEGRGDEFEANA